MSYTENWRYKKIRCVSLDAYWADVPSDKGNNMLTYNDTVSSLICEILLRAVHWSQLKKQQTECEML